MWCISRGRRPILPFRRERGGECGAHISHEGGGGGGGGGGRLILLLDGGEERKVGRISRMQDLEGVCPS